MNDWKRELDRCREIAALAERAGDMERVVHALRRAADTLRVDPESIPDTAREQAHGDICGRLGELLWEERLPEAIQAYQEAADAYGRTLRTELSVACARKVVEGVRLLRHRPAERLDLLIARYDRDLREMAEHPGTEMAQADLQFKVATVLQRRDRFEAAAERYQNCLGLYSRIEEGGPGSARCHHRLADLYHHELGDDKKAVAHFRRAIELYAQHEPESEGEQMNRVLCEWHLREVERRARRR